MKKTYLIIGVATVILFLLIIVTLILTNNTSSNPFSKKDVPMPTKMQTAGGEEFDDYKRTTNKPALFDDTSLPTDAPINYFNFTLVGTALPSGFTQVYVEKNSTGEKLSPDKLSKAQIQDTTLIISDNKTNKVLKTASIENTGGSNFTWINNKIVLLIEKESNSRAVDYLYLVEKDSGKKTFIIGSFPIAQRLNLSFDPLVFNNGQEIILQDNQAQYWQLSIR